MVSARKMPLIVIGALIISFLAVGAVVYYSAISGQVRASSSGGDSGEAIASSSSGSHAASAFDVSDKRKLTGFAHNVFVGRVVERVGTTSAPTSSSGPGVPYTQYSVEVQRNIKGTLSGTVTVSQQGGYISYVPEVGPDEGQLVKELQLLNGDELLKPSRPYLFVTRYDKAEDFYQITTPNLGDVPINSQAERNELTEAFEAAQANQINPAKVR